MRGVRPRGKTTNGMDGRHEDSVRCKRDATEAKKSDYMLEKNEKQ